ncbi:MAG TPA: AraC family transcriptional regulator [Candidatus Baltobacteraceae bacterium]|nr:AraC family transcriptional regulator [Candidatus Baltobacteraceae bacterium]
MRFFGDGVLSRQAGPFSFTESIFAPRAVLPAHTHGSSYLTITLLGSYRETYGPNERECVPGTSVTHPAFETHSQRFGVQEALLLRVAWREGTLEADERLAPIERAAATRNAAIARAAQKIHEELQSEDASSELILEGLALELAACSLGNPAMAGGSRARAMQTEALLRASLRSTLSAKSLAARLGVSKATFFRDFRCTFGCTPGEYQRRLRVAAAIAALRKSDVPFSDIAAQCGFYDQSHFNRAFRRAVGISPAQFRRLILPY